MSTTEVSIENAAAHLRVTAASLDTAHASCTAAQATLAAAVGYQEAGRSAKAKLKVLQAEDALETATLRMAECERVHAAARTMWETLVRRAFVDRDLARTRAARMAAQAIAADLHAGLADRQAVAALLGVCDGGSHPAASAVPFVEALEAHLRVLDPPPPGPTPPPPAGQVRVQAIVEFQDATERWRHPVGTVTCLPEAEARQVIEKRWAVEVSG